MILASMLASGRHTLEDGEHTGTDDVDPFDMERPILLILRCIAHIAAIWIVHHMTVTVVWKRTVAAGMRHNFLGGKRLHIFVVAITQHGPQLGTHRGRVATTMHIHT